MTPKAAMADETRVQAALVNPQCAEQLTRPPACLAWNASRATISKMHSSRTHPALHFAVLGKGSRMHLL